jgi:hypothetical protein
MIRMFKYDSCNKWMDFPNDVFRNDYYDISFSHNEDKVAINKQVFRISSILHIHGSGSPANSIQSSFYTKFKTNVKQAIQTLINC